MLILSTATSYAQQWEWVHNSQGGSSLSYTEDVAVDTVREVMYATGYVTGNPNFSEIPIADYSGMDDGFIMKYDLDGNVIWGFLVGGTGNDRINGIEVDQNTGNIFVTGYIVGNSGSNGTNLEGYSPGATSAVTGSNGGEDAFVAMYNMSGQLVWYRVFGGSDLDRGMDIAINSTGVYATGVYTNTVGLNLFPLILALNNSVNNFTVALDKSSGSNIWDVVQGSGADDFIEPLSTSEVVRIGITADENSVYTVTYFGGVTYRIFNTSDDLVATHSDSNSSEQDFVVTSYSSSGAYNWSVLYDNSSSVVNGLDITNDCDGVYVSGTLHNNGVTPGGTVINSPHDNPIISKLNKSTGSEVWVKDFTSAFNHYDFFIGIDADNYGNLFALGRLRGTSLSSGADFNFTGGQNYSEPMLMRYGTDGTFKSFEVLPSSSSSWGTSLSLYKNEKYAAGGYYNTAVTFGTTSTNNTSMNNAFVAFRDRLDPISFISATGDSVFCQSESTASPLLDVPMGGTFSGPSSVVFNSTTTGEIDLTSSTPGGPYTISYTGFPISCNAPTVVDCEIYIVADDDPSFTFVVDTFCVNGPNPTPTVSGTQGGSFSGTPGLIIEPSNGEVDVASSSLGTYWVVYTTNGVCTASDSVEITVYEAPNASFSYPQIEYCSTEANPLPNVSTAGGTFSSSAGLVINPTTGEIDLAASTPGGPYTVQYLVSNLFCSDSKTSNVTINATEDASFSYAASHFCQNESNPTPIITGTAGGTFTGSSGLSVSTSGEIDVTASTIGGPYWVVYTTPGSVCPTSDSVQVYIEEEPDPSFSYAESAYCTNESDPAATISGLTGGTFSSSAGLMINPTTGEIDLSASAAGVYTVQYVVSNTYCANSATFDITINGIQDASFSYSASHFCQNESNPTPIITGTTGGTFTGSSGLSVSSTGEIDVAVSTVGGPYWVVYTTPGPICPVSDSVQVSIEAVPDPSFSYAESIYCNNDTDPVPTVSGATGGTFSAGTGLVINPSTGEINLMSSSVGGPYSVEYVVTNAYCSDSSTFDVTINATEDASFSYSASHFCQNEANPVPAITGTTGGTFTGPAGLVISTGGEIDVVASIVGGPYWVTYTTPGTLCPVSDSVEVYIEGLPNAYFDYDQSSYCQGAGTTILPNETIPGGMYNAPADVVINSGTGVIDIDASLAGGPYTIERIVSNTYCQKTYTFEITILAQDDLVSVTYGSSDFCVLDGNQIPVIDGLNGGTFSGPTSIDLVNSSTGEFSPSSSIPGGPYYIQYITGGACPDSVETSVSVLDVVSAYAGEDQELYFTFSSTLEADVPMVGVGEWATSSSATFDDLIDPNTDVYDLQLGENVFVWTVTNGVCPAAFDEMIINVRDVFIPQAVTPNGDGKNDFFELMTPEKSSCSVQIFNRWGQVVYENSDYNNGWYGQNLQGEELMSDTYFYTIVIDDSLTYNGYVVLKK